MMAAREVRLPMVNPRPSTTVATMDGQRIGYTNYDLPADISGASGWGCVGRTLGVPNGSPVPIAVCEVHISDGVEFLVCLRVECPAATAPDGEDDGPFDPTRAGGLFEPVGDA